MAERIRKALIPAAEFGTRFLPQTKAMPKEMINKRIPVHAVEIKNAIYRDTGNKLKYLETVVEYGLKHPEFGKEFADFLKNLKI